jgi:transposase InsO family protein
VRPSKLVRHAADASLSTSKNRKPSFTEIAYTKLRTFPPRKVQWLSDNGSIFAAHRTLEIAAALNLNPCFTPVESPESNGIAEAFVKTFKRDYVRINPLPPAGIRAQPHSRA